MKRKHFDLYKIFIYVALISLAISIIIPVSWVFLASIKTNAEFYGNPWALPQGFNIQNFIDAFQIAQVGDFILNSALVTAMALAISPENCMPPSAIMGTPAARAGTARTARRSDRNHRHRCRRPRVR